MLSEVPQSSWHANGNSGTVRKFGTEENGGCPRWQRDEILCTAVVVARGGSPIFLRPEFPHCPRITVSAHPRFSSAILPTPDYSAPVESWVVFSPPRARPQSHCPSCASRYVQRRCCCMPLHSWAAASTLPETP